MATLIKKDNLYSKGFGSGKWKKSIDSDPTTLPKRNVTIEIEEDGISYLCIHHMTQDEPSTSYGKLVFKKLKLTDSPSEIWTDIYTHTEYIKPDQYVNSEGDKVPASEALNEDGTLKEGYDYRYDYLNVKFNRDGEETPDQGLRDFLIEIFVPDYVEE